MWPPIVSLFQLSAATLHTTRHYVHWNIVNHFKTITMYTVNKGPSKLMAKTRGSLSQNYDKIESIRDIVRPVDNNRTTENDIISAKPVFQQYRRTYSNRNNTESRQSHHHNSHNQQQQQLSPQYEDMVKYIKDSWNLVVAQNPYENNGSSMDSDVSSKGSSVTNTAESKDSNNVNSTQLHAFIPPVSTTTKVSYYNDPPSPDLKDFGPFDLESWWGRRLFNNITKSL